jgi:Gnt-I system low-affinity gluconate transporter
MTQTFLLLTVAAAVILLLFLVLKLKINAFIALLVVSMFVGLTAGMKADQVLDSIQKGMGGTLGFVATVVGLGAIFGQILESSGGAESMAKYLVGKFGTGKASWAMVITGFFVAIPVFFDVGFIILVPIVYALSRDTKKSVLYYGIPLLAGLAVTHSFVPPTPGPVAVADIIHAQLGYVILWGFLLSFPIAILAGPVWGRYISRKINIAPPGYFDLPRESDNQNLPSFSVIITLIGIPLILILLATFTDVMVQKGIVVQGKLTDMIKFIGHPFSALTLSTLLSIYFLGIRRGMSRQYILELSTKALGPAGIIILITGAGGVLKQVLIDSGIGNMMAESIAGKALPPVLLAWVMAAIVRVTQGSATVAMITAAGLIAPVLEVVHPSEVQKALIVLAIASGATILSHVNDSGFWLVGKYLGMTEKQTLKSWTVMETIIALSGLVLTLLVSFLVG